MPLVIAGDRSGVGKTTVTAAILASLMKRQVVVQSFKVGPDYIDPMFHSRVTQRACRNLDPILTSESYVQSLFTTHIQGADFVLVEGVMGLFDGAVGQGGKGSTAHIAQLLNLPVLLVLDCGRLSDSIAALVHGYCSFDQRLQIVGIVLNQVGSDRHLNSLKSALQPLGVAIIGVVHRQQSVRIPDRHLGLVPIEELTEVNGLLQKLTDLGNRCFDWSVLLPLLATSSFASQGHAQAVQSLSQNLPQPLQSSATELNSVDPSLSVLGVRSLQSSQLPTIRLAIARDAAFNFYYADNLERLVQLGAELVYWSPLSDQGLPPDIQGLYLGGGFPEMFAAELAANTRVRQALKIALQQGLPTYAECGGLMYLCESLQTLQGQTLPMVGVLPTAVKMAARLTLGYRCAIATHNTPLLTKGTTVWGHEFHHSQLHQEVDDPIYTFSPDPRSRTSTPSEGWHLYNIHASYLHLHWGHRLEIPQRFIQHCQAFQTKG